MLKNEEKKKEEHALGDKFIESNKFRIFNCKLHVLQVSAGGYKKTI